MVFKIENTDVAEHIFYGWEETMIWSCLQNVMGCIYGDSVKRPVSAMAMLGDFAFLGGKPDKEVLSYGLGQSKKDVMILVPCGGEWGNLIKECYGMGAKKVVRYAFKKEPDVFEKEKLQKAVALLSDEYTLKMVDEELFWRCKDLDWCKDFTVQYADYEMYKKYGLGALILKNGEIVSGASSYSGYLGGIEIEVDTRADFRRKGLAFACGAKLILECLNRGWYPSWDAQNLWSAALAEKLGYRLDYAYTAYEII